MARGEYRTMIGGQAVIEGVMMRGVRSTAMAVRKPDGSINLDIWENRNLKNKYPILGLPFLRGVINFAEMLIFGYKSLMASAEIAGVEQEEEKKESPEEKKASQGMKAAEWGSMILGFLCAILLFSVAPAYLIKFTDPVFHFGAFKTLLEGVVRIAVFVGYLFAISRMKDIRRLYEYHGAEHKTIYCYEHGDELTAGNARKYTRFHPRCGTSFLLIVLIISILVFSLPFVPWNNIPLRILVKLLLLPVVVGISYEIIKFAGRHDNTVMRFLLAPGLWMQRLTTREPDDTQLEVAIASLRAVLTGNREEDKW